MLETLLVVEKLMGRALESVTVRPTYKMFPGITSVVLGQKMHAATETKKRWHEAVSSSFRVSMNNRKSTGRSETSSPLFVKIRLAANPEFLLLLLCTEIYPSLTMLHIYILGRN